MTPPRCQQTDESRVAFAFGELPAEEARELQSHLKECAACRAAVEELSQAADLVRLVRQEPLPPEPAFRPLALPHEEVRGLGRFWLGWAAGALATAAVALALWLGFGPPPTEVVPPTPIPQAAPQPSLPSVQPGDRPVLAVHVLAREGALLREVPGQGPARPIPPGSTLRAGDELWTGPEAHALLRLDDASRVRLSRSSRLRLEASAETGDRFGLVAGAVACQVSPRPLDRPFLLTTPLADVQVKGTRFAVRIEGPGGLWVAVEEGVVEILPRHPGARRLRLQPGQAAQVRANQAEPIPLDATGRAELTALLAPLIDMPDDAPRPALAPHGRDRPRPPRPDLTRVPPPPPPRDVVQAEVPPEPAPPDPVVLPTGDSLQALVESLYQDTAWIFDDMRADLAQGRFDRVLRSIELYLADPDSPNRPEAIFLKAVCLEKLGRQAEARKVYLEYAARWPQGQRVRDAHRGFLRTSRGVH